MARYTLLEALRTRFPVMVLVAVALLVLISFFVDALAVTESGRFQASVYAAGMRLAGVFIAALYVLVSIAREFSDKGFDVVLALDLPRAHYVLGRLAGFLALAAVIGLSWVRPQVEETEVAGRSWRFVPGSLRQALAPLLWILAPMVALGLPLWVRNVALYGAWDVLGLRWHDQVVIGQARTSEWIAVNGWVAYGDFSTVKIHPEYDGPRPLADDFIPYDGDYLKLDRKFDPALSHAFRCALLLGGVDWMGWHGSTSSAHTDDDVDRTATAFESAIDLLRRAGLVP